MNTGMPEAVITRETPLYRITMLVPRFPYEGKEWRDVRISIVRSKESPHTYDWATLIDLEQIKCGEVLDRDRDWTYMDKEIKKDRPMREVSLQEWLGYTYQAEFVSHECFTGAEAEAIRAWLKRHDDFVATVAPVTLPTSYGPVDACGTGGSTRQPRC